MKRRREENVVTGRAVRAGPVLPCCLQLKVNLSQRRWCLTESSWAATGLPGVSGYHNLAITDQAERGRRPCCRAL